MIHPSSDMAYPPTAHAFMFPAAHDHQDDLNTLPFPSHPPQHFNGSASFLMKRSMSFSGLERSNEEVHADDDLSDDGSHAGEKKKRLNLEQVKALEKSFELGNKLEPERKVQLAKALGMQPRQIAIWFQNRRARWKTKQLEKDYEVLKKQFEALKADNESLQAQNKKLHAELLALRNRDSNEAGTINMKKETEGYASNGSENSSEINLDNSIAPITVMNSPAVVSSHQLTSKLFFPLSSNRATTTSMTQLLQGSSRSSDQFQCLKVDQMIQDESFCNIFGGVEDQPGYWPWHEQQQYN